MVVKFSTAPKHDEIEFTVFGPGVGESSLLHYGDNEWLIVDSCSYQHVNPAYQYLKNLGLNPSKCVKKIILTHWHDDHIKGAAKLIEDCKCAEVYISGAFFCSRFTDVILDSSFSISTDRPTGVSNIIKVLFTLKFSQRKLYFLQENTCVIKKNNLEVFALSPSNYEVKKSLNSIISQMKKNKNSNGVFDQKVQAPSPNDISISLYCNFENLNKSILLGADLENSGWEYMKENLRNIDYPKSHVYKVSHHGSLNANHEFVWNHLLTDKPISIIAPKTSSRLPAKKGIDTIKTKSSETYITYVEPVNNDRRVTSNDRYAQNCINSKRSVQKIPQKHDSFICLRYEQGKQVFDNRLSGNAQRV